MVAQQPFRNDERNLLASQLGLITRVQANKCGETPASIKTKVERGEWVRAARGVYRATLFPVSKEQRLLAQCLRAPGKVWASHRTAAWIHGLGLDPGREIQFTALGQLTSGPGCRIHRTASIAPCDVTVVKNVPVTAIERTLLDLASSTETEELDAAVDEALISRMTSLEKIEWRLRRTGGRGRPGSTALRRCLERRRRIGQVDSHLERRFLGLLRKAEVPPPQLQYPIEVGSRTLYADFAYPDKKLIIEVLGYRWHGGREKWERDLLRSSDIGAAGWRIIYVTKNQIVHARRQTIDRVREALGYGPLFVL